MPAQLTCNVTLLLSQLQNYYIANFPNPSTFTAATYSDELSSMHAPGKQFPLIDWISDTLSQGYTNLQSLENAWIIEILHLIHYAVKQGCVRLRNALKCTLRGYIYSHEE